MKPLPSPIRAISWMLIVVLISQPCVVVVAQTQDKCATNLRQAQAKFDQGEFDASIRLAQECARSKDASDDQKVKAYEILAQNYLSKGSSSQANDAIRRLLEIESGYEPNPDQTSPAYIAQVDRVRGEMGGKSGGGFPWLYVAGGAVLVGAAVVLIASKSKDEGTPAVPELPGPPIRP